MVKFCPECGNPITDINAEFCAKCGSKLPIKALIEQTPVHRPNALDNHPSGSRMNLEEELKAKGDSKGLFLLYLIKLFIIVVVLAILWYVYPYLSQWNIPIGTITLGK